MAKKKAAPKPTDKAAQVPLVELMRSVPAGTRLELETNFAEDGRCIGHRMVPVARYLHEAADEISRLQSALAEAERRIEELKGALRELFEHDENGAAVRYRECTGDSHGAWQAKKRWTSARAAMAGSDDAAGRNRSKSDDAAAGGR